ncbi:MAG TPA: S8 family serine peptidase, partial [Allocoleopsis sp.]
MARYRIPWLAWCIISGVACSLVSLPGMAVMQSVGADGIDAYRLQQPPYSLTGRKIAIGQVEIGRPVQFGLDKAGATNQAVQPYRLFYRDIPAQAADYANTRIDERVHEHAANVASIMISRDKTFSGVAPDAVLYAAAVGTEERGEQPEACLTTQTVAQQNSGDVRTINLSFGESLEHDPRPHPVLDGNALLTQCIDWLARVENVLPVIAGNEERGGFPIPTDTFNGMVIASSTRLNGRFSKVDFESLGSEPMVVLGRDPAMESNVGPRRSVVLVAPGAGLEALSSNGSIASAPVSGTSFAAPHVAATVALLQEFGDRSIRQVLAEQGTLEGSHWTLDAR